MYIILPLAMGFYHSSWPCRGDELFMYFYALLLYIMLSVLHRHGYENWIRMRVPVSDAVIEKKKIWGQVEKTILIKLYIYYFFSVV